MSTFWNGATKAVRVVDSYVAYIKKYTVVDKLVVALAVTKMWAYAGLYTTKVLEAFFMMFLSMPDKWLKLPSSLVNSIGGPVANTSGQKINILLANSEMGDITNKLKLFLRFYWEKGGDASSVESNGFDFMKLRKLLNCSMLYCCYLLTDKSSNIKPEEFWNNVNKFLIDCEKLSNDLSDPDIKCYMSKKEDRSDRKALPFRHVSFDLEKYEDKTDADVDLSDMVRNLVADLEKSN